MKQKTTLTVGCLSAALLCAPAYGDDFQGRWYFGLGGGMSKLEPDTTASQYELDETEDTSFRMVIGRDLTRYLSAELYLADLGEVTLSPKAGAVNPVADPSVSYRVGGLHLLAYLFNSDGDDGRFYRDSFSAYLKLGMGTMDNESTVEYERLEDLHFSYGIGIEGLIGGGVSWRAEVEMFDEDASQASLTLIKRFGGVTGTPALAVADTTEAAEPVDPVVAADRKLEAMMAEKAEDKTVTMAAEPTPELPAEPVVSAAPVATETVVAPVITSAAPTAEEEPLEAVVAQVESVATPAAAAADSDQDGVLDTADRCPGTESGLAVDTRGCSFSGIVEGLYFDRGSDSLSESAKAILDNVVLELRRFPNVVLEVQAHTDNRGKAVDNLALSQLRAEAVANYMVSRGISGSRIRARGFGESRPAFRNATEEGRRRNRRVVFQTVEKLM